ncbi:MAG: glycosyltransferase family 2 protein [Collinsella sp.]
MVIEGIGGLLTRIAFGVRAHWVYPLGGLRLSHGHKNFDALKTPEGGVIKLCVRTLLIADSEAMSHFCIHIKYASRCYPQKNTNVNNQPKVAIIVPVYNVASYLRECLNSILTQTYTNFTVFAVDDGSTDESGAILDEYAATDTRIVAIHQKNAGQGAARNNALARIETLGTFDYVTFADGDDKVYNGFVDQLVKTAERTSADISICAFHYLEADGVHAYGRLHEEMVLDKDAYFEFVISAGARPEYHGIIGTGGHGLEQAIQRSRITRCSIPHG